MATAAIPYILGAMGTMQVVGALQQGQAAKASADYNADIMRKNAALAEMQGNVQAEAAERAGRLRTGAAIASYGAAGVSATGSPLDVLAESARAATLDALTAKYNAKLKGLGFETQANLAQAEGRNAVTSSYFNSAGYAAKGAYSVLGSMAPAGGSGVNRGAYSGGLGNGGTNNF